MVERIVVGPMNTNAYLYSEWKKECILIDPGGSPDEIIEHMTIKNLKPRGILLTHGHIDHIAAVGAVQLHFSKLSIQTPIAIHREDAGFLGRGSARRHKKIISKFETIDVSYFESASAALPAADILLEEGQHVFDSDLVVIHTPGHTPGSICVYSETQEVLFSGDTLLFEGIGETGLTGTAKKALLLSVRERLFTLPRSIRLFPGHGPFTTLEREIKHNPYFVN
jgi:glyoxylase-like metal-dependent hydrolase (beta-lactamase superfamily II)